MRKGTRSSSNQLYTLKRNLIERNRRKQMKDLYSTLSSLLPRKPTMSKHQISVVELLHEAKSYVNKLEERVEELQLKKQQLLSANYYSFQDQKRVPSIIMNIKIMDHDDLDINVTSDGYLTKNFMLYEVFRILHQEGAQVTSSTYHNARDKVFYTFQCQAVSSRIGIETTRVLERLKKLGYTD